MRQYITDVEKGSGLQGVSGSGGQISSGEGGQGDILKKAMKSKQLEEDNKRLRKLLKS